MHLISRFVVMTAVLVLGGCVSHMYPDTRVPELKPVEKGASLRLGRDVTFRNAKRANSTILYAGTYTHAYHADTGDFYAHDTRMIGLLPPYGSAEQFEGGLYIPHDSKQPCLIYWFTPDLYSKGLAVQLITGEFGKLEFYTWVPGNLADLPHCQNRPTIQDTP